jgi:hypothetical protein
MNPNLPTWWHDASIPFNYDVIIIILDCNPNPCKHGTCQSNEAGYVCICDDGYGGANCDTGFAIHIYIYIYTRVTRRAPHVKQELITQPEIRCPPSRFLVPVRIARSLVFCVLFCRSLFVFLSFYLGLWVICPWVSSNFSLSMLLHTIVSTVDYV